ncbi:hypothetical protein B566_EDAN011795 [Ephemera danica]|nr:hypothetical protein B566_EDAN011795 [Ephemera danica]
MISVMADPGSGNLITFSQFLFIAVEGFIFTAKCGAQEPVIDMRAYVNLVVMFFTSSVCNNYSLNFNVPMPLHMIFRSGSLVANMALGVVILKRRYTTMKYTSVLMITAGIILCTFESSKHVHLLPLPGFLLILPNIQNHLTGALNTQPMQLLPGFAMPISLVYLILNMCTSLTVTLLVTLRKFLSLIFSVLYFHNTFTITHWLGASLVFIGTFLFSGVFSTKSSTLSTVLQKDAIHCLRCQQPKMFRRQPEQQSNVFLKFALEPVDDGPESPPPLIRLAAEPWQPKILQEPAQTTLQPVSPLRGSLLEPVPETSVVYHGLMVTARTVVAVGGSEADERLVVRGRAGQLQLANVCRLQQAGRLRNEHAALASKVRAERRDKLCSNWERRETWR